MTSRAGWQRQAGTTTRTALVYDPLGRLYQTSGGGAATTRVLYDGDEPVEKYGASDAVLRRYVHGAQDDDPLIWYEGAGLTDEGGVLVADQHSVEAGPGFVQRRYEKDRRARQLRSDRLAFDRHE